MQGKTLEKKTRARSFLCSWLWPNVSPRYLLSLEWVSGKRGAWWLLQQVIAACSSPIPSWTPAEQNRDENRDENRDGAAAPPGQDVPENGATASSHHGADKTQRVPLFAARLCGFQGWGK